MAERPVIVVVDDEPDALSAMLDALTRRFGGDYRVVPYLFAQAALDAICMIKEEEEEIALVIADQGMPEMTGRDFLGRVRSIVPTASNHAAPLLLAARSTGISCQSGELH
jgi:thioredoxin reductase (NADPH)